MPDYLIENDTTDTQVNPQALRVGAGLREVRERLGWRLPDVAVGLRIRPEFLEAIEHGDLSSLPGPAYRAGFVRSYAQALGLDDEEILSRFRDAGQLGESPKSEIQFLAPVPDRGVPKGAIVFIGFLVVLAAYGLWYHHTEQARRLAQAVPQVPAQLQPLAIPPKVNAPATDPQSAPAKPKPAAAEPPATP
ncbi:MAG: helix-turn-helix domain-containing protein, partial [Rhodospirillales bacterium]|nr:helix-turn-helix domain-containing protein [Rhodospirillales bacterium]